MLVRIVLVVGGLSVDQLNFVSPAVLWDQLETAVLIVSGCAVQPVGTS